MKKTVRVEVSAAEFQDFVQGKSTKIGGDLQIADEIFVDGSLDVSKPQVNPSPFLRKIRAIKGGFRMHGTVLDEVTIQNATIEGGFEIHRSKVGQLMLSGTRISRDVSLAAVEIKAGEPVLSLFGLSVGGSLDLRLGEIEHHATISFRDLSVGQNLFIDHVLGDILCRSSVVGLKVAGNIDCAGDYDLAGMFHYCEHGDKIVLAPTSVSILGEFVETLKQDSVAAVS